MFKRDQVIGLGLMAVGIFFWVLTSQFSMPLTPEYPGPKMLPTLAVFGLVVCGLGIFIESTRKQMKEKVFLGFDGWKRVALTFAVLILYVLGLKYLGYLISTPLLLYAVTSMFAKGKNVRVWAKILYSVLFTLLVYLVYVQLFNLALPRGMLF